MPIPSLTLTISPDVLMFGHTRSLIRLYRRKMPFHQAHLINIIVDKIHLDWQLDNPSRFSDGD
jgi:hypothetical protein